MRREVCVLSHRAVPSSRREPSGLRLGLGRRVAQPTEEKVRQQHDDLGWHHVRSCSPELGSLSNLELYCLRPTSSRSTVGRGVLGCTTQASWGSPSS